MNEGMWSARSPRSISTEEGRPRWGDRGVATGRLWEPTAPTARLPQVRDSFHPQFIFFLFFSP